MLTLTLDPALRKLLDELPVGDPDRPMAEVWIDHCPVREMIPLGTPTHINFGPWMGPLIRLSEVVVHARVGPHHGSSALGEGEQLVRVGIALHGTVQVNYS